MDDITDEEYFGRAKEVFRARVVAIGTTKRIGVPNVRLEVLAALKGSPPRFITFEHLPHPLAGICPALSERLEVGEEAIYIRGQDATANATPETPRRYLKLRGQERVAYPKRLGGHAALANSDDSLACEFATTADKPYCEEQRARYAALLKLAAEAGTAPSAMTVQPSKEQLAYLRYVVRPLSPDAPTECGPLRAIESGQLANYNLAFVAEPTSIQIVDHVGHVDHRAVTKEVLEVQYKVTSRLKGKPPATFTVRSDLPGVGGCGLDFRRAEFPTVLSGRGRSTVFLLDKWHDFVSMTQARPMNSEDHQRWADLEAADLAMRGNIGGVPGRTDEELVAMSKQIVRAEIVDDSLPLPPGPRYAVEKGGWCMSQVRAKEVLMGPSHVPPALNLSAIDSCGRIQRGREYVLFIMKDGPPFHGLAQAAYEYTGTGADVLRTVKLRQLAVARATRVAR